LNGKTMEHNPSDESPELGLLIGIDWADAEHTVHVLDRQGRGHSEQLEQTPEAIEAWITQKIEQADGKDVAIILEQSRGALVHALMFRERVVLYPVNPKQLARYRESYSNAGCKADVSDAFLLVRLLRERRGELRAWQPDDERTRLLARLCLIRRQLVDEHTRLTQQLINLLKSYYPLAFAVENTKSITPLLLELLHRWADPRELQRADRRLLHLVFKANGYRSESQRAEMIERIRSATLLSRDRALLEPSAIMARNLASQIRILRENVKKLDQQIDQEFGKHPDAELFRSLPGAGKALAPRLLTAFGSQRDRYASANDLATFSGIAPVTRQSGKSRFVHRRYACPRFLRQTFHEFADHARKWCPWSRAYYTWQRSRGMKHHAVLRKLALRWIRILFRVWQSRTPYDPARYLQAIQRKNPAIVPFLKPTTT
jgi:transposase